MAGLWVEEVAGPDDRRRLVVFVHGSLDRASSFSKVVRRLRDLHTVVYDRRGYAGSIDVGPPFTVASQVEDLLFVMQERPAVVVGHSYGGNVALAAAQARPDLVRAVVVFEAPMPWADWWPPTSGGYSIVRQIARRRRPGRHLRAVHAPDDRRRAMGAPARGDAREPSRRGPRARRRDHRSGQDGALRRRRRSWCRSSPPAARTGQPITGSRPSFLFSTLPNPTMVTINDAGHGAHTTHPDEFAAIVRLAVATGG